MEADLARYYGIDYRDRWRTPRLTLRRLSVLVRHLPPDGAVATELRDGLPHWSVEAHLLDDLRMVWTGSEKKPAKPHESRPRPERRPQDTPERRRKLTEARARARARAAAKKQEGE